METKNPFSCCEPNGLSRFSRICLYTGQLAGGARKLKIQIGAKQRLRGCMDIVKLDTAPGWPDANNADDEDTIINAFPTQTRAMKHLEPKEAYEFLKTHPDSVLIDCRSEIEYLFVGHPVGALSIPWNDGPDWEVNPHFVGHVRVAASVDRPVLLICRSGSRTLDAGAALEKAGFTQVYNVLHGFEGELDSHHHRNSVSGWRFEGLPWEQT